MSDERIMMKNPNTGRDDRRIAVAIYEPVRDAILGALAEGQLPNADLYDAVQARTPAALWKEASLKWYTTTVKLHLEATGMLAKEGSPQMLSITPLGEKTLS